jgi:molybdopterin synthase catalytic subunit/molybdopterin converting factor small subunit
MNVRLLAFAALRERLGFSERSLELPEGTTAAEAAAFALGGPVPRGLSFAVNREVAPGTTPLHEGDELALLPPVSGGVSLLRVQPHPIDVQALVDETGDPSCGAVLAFVGTAREVPGDTLVHLEYEAYPEMAEAFFRELAQELGARFGVERVAIVHRTGRVLAGEASIAIVVASPHRGPGFDALRHAIERIKEGAPVWKKEVTRSGEKWIAVEKMEGG